MCAICVYWWWWVCVLGLGHGKSVCRAIVFGESMIWICCCVGCVVLGVLFASKPACGWIDMLICCLLCWHIYWQTLACVNHMVYVGRRCVCMHVYEWLFVFAHICVCALALYISNHINVCMMPKQAASFAILFFWLLMLVTLNVPHGYINKCHVYTCPMLSLHLVCCCECQARPCCCSRAGLSLACLCVCMICL